MKSKGSFYKRIFLLTFIISLITLLGVCDYLIPNALSDIAKGEQSDIGGIIMLENKDTSKTVASLFGVPLKSVSTNNTDDSYVYLGGDAIGVKFYTGGAMVVGISDVGKGKISSPARNAGLKMGDLITKVDGQKVESTQMFQKIIENSEGKTLLIEFKRGDKIKNATLSPVKNEDGAYKAGMWIRDSTAGIGTVTYVTADGIFGSLGHGISDADTGTLMPLSRGSCVKISVDYAVKGKPNVPGELKGVFSNNTTGSLVSNTATGLYGSFTADNYKNRELVKLGTKDDIHIGKAQIIATVDEQGSKFYDIEIAQIVQGSKDGKNLIVKITDDELIKKTGGIVQGMSGSPIIQDGKLVGAITHVMVGDPTRGYGIYIENMLNNSPKVS